MNNVIDKFSKDFTDHAGQKKDFISGIILRYWISNLDALQRGRRRRRRRRRRSDRGAQGVDSLSGLPSINLAGWASGAEHVVGMLAPFRRECSCVQVYWRTKLTTSLLSVVSA